MHQDSLDAPGVPIDGIAPYPQPAGGTGGTRWKASWWNGRIGRSCSNFEIRGLHSSQITKELIPLLTRQIHLLTIVWMDHHCHLLTFSFFLFFLKSFGFLLLIFHTLLLLVLLKLPFQRFLWIDTSFDRLIYRLDRFG